MWGWMRLGGQWMSVEVYHTIRRLGSMPGGSMRGSWTARGGLPLSARLSICVFSSVACEGGWIDRGFALGSGSRRRFGCRGESPNAASHISSEHTRRRDRKPSSDDGSLLDRGRPFKRGGTGTYHLSAHLEVEVVQRRLQEVGVGGHVAVCGNEQRASGLAREGRGALRQSLGRVSKSHRTRRTSVPRKINQAPRCQVERRFIERVSTAPSRLS